MMKAIQITIDEEILEEIDRQTEVSARGRSAFIRAAVADFLRRRREAEIDAAYRRGYGESSPDLDEVEPWLEEQVWPEK